MNTALISGGTSGIGLATAAVLLDRGWQVAVSGRNRERGQAALQQLEGKGAVHYIEGDVSRDEDCRKMVIETVRRFGGLDGLVTSAGIYEQGLLENVTPDDVKQLFAVNVYGTISLCKYALPHLRRRPGSIVTVSSDAGLQGNIACSVYGATKGAVVALPSPWPWKRHRTRYGSTASVPVTSKRRCSKNSSGIIPIWSGRP